MIKTKNKHIYIIYIYIYIYIYIHIYTQLGAFQYCSRDLPTLFVSLFLELKNVLWQ